MITGEVKAKVDRIWDAFWSGGISNPLEVIEQITYLLFLRRLDDLEALEENKAARLKAPRLIVPPLLLQQAFARRIAAIEKLKASYRASLAELDALFASLQHRAFRGEL